MARDNSENLVYAASKALWRTEQRSRRREGALTRLFRFFSTVSKTKKELDEAGICQREKRRKAYFEIYCDALAPVHETFADINDCAWNFILTFFRDLGNLIVDIANIFITAGYYIWSVILFIYDYIQDFLFWCEGRKYMLLRIAIAGTLSVVGIAFFVNSITAYEYSYYGKVLGTAKSKSTVYDTIEVLGDRLSKSSGANVSLNVERDIEFKTVRGFGLKTDSPDDILNTLTYMKDLQVNAFSIVVAGNTEVILEDETTAKNVLRDIRNAYAGEKPGVEYTDVHYTKDVVVEEVSVKLGDIWNAQDAKKYLMTGSIVDHTHTVGQYESYTEILEMYGLNAAQLRAANPDVDLESLSPGQVLQLSAPEPIINVASTEIATYYENIDFGTQYIDNALIYEGETEVKSDGIYGQNEIVASITRINGQEITKDIISTTKISNPVDQVLYRGTKPVPEKLGTGTFIVPMKSYSITSRVGWRWGRMHKGIDLANSTGTKIYAADGGIVTFAGWENGYGYVVKIDHGGLLTTVYAHCSKIIVSQGEKVYQGQNIALVGSTGNSTGPHLHFEIWYNGEFKNPEDYLDF